MRPTNQEKASRDLRFLRLVTQDLALRLELVDPSQSRGYAELQVSEDGTRCYVRVHTFGDQEDEEFEFLQGKESIPYMTAAAFAQRLEQDGYAIAQ